ncbi:MAG: hypothetical protein ACHQ49_06895 [Elusimicrobiota bacterium]
MRQRSNDVAADPAALRDKALNLRESVNSSRARISAQREKLERLRLDLAELRALLDRPLHDAARPAVPLPLLAPSSKEAASDSAPAAASFKTDARSGGWRPVPYIAIFFVAVGLQLHSSRTAVIASRAAAAAAAPIAAPAAAEDDGADEALLLAHDWSLPGDDRPLSDRLGNGTNPPGTEPEWTAERTGERTFRVSFRPSGSDASYDFDVDLTARRVDPTAETAELISPHLASRR